LRLLPSADLIHRRALYTLGPGPPGRTGPSGSAPVEGSIDLTGGTIDLRPKQESAQMDGLGQVGLQGKSEDGGRTFSGRVTVNPQCTVFTLRRMS
jgi:hypothetical protein